MHSSDEKSGGLSPYLSTLGAVSLAFGCAVGCGAFVMPGTTFLPVAGPLGTLIGLGVGAGGVFLCGKPPALQVFAIVALAPWAFVGFESVSQSAAEFACPRWRKVRNSAITAGSAGFWYNIHFMAKKGDEYI